MKKEYKVEIIKEGALGTILLGSSKLPLKKMEEVMNKYGENGWDIAFQLIEKHRMLLFWSREAVIITFSRDKKTRPRMCNSFGRYWRAAVCKRI